MASAPSPADGRPARRVRRRTAGDPRTARLAARVGADHGVHGARAAPAVPAPVPGRGRSACHGRLLGAVPGRGVGPGTGARSPRHGRRLLHPLGARAAPRRPRDGPLRGDVRAGVDTRLGRGPPARRGRRRRLAHFALRGPVAHRGLDLRCVCACPPRLPRRVRPPRRTRRGAAAGAGPRRRGRGTGPHRPRDPRRPRARHHRHGPQRRGSQAGPPHRPLGPGPRAAHHRHHRPGRAARTPRTPGRPARRRPVRPDRGRPAGRCPPGCGRTRPRPATGAAVLPVAPENGCGYGGPVS